EMSTVLAAALERNPELAGLAAASLAAQAGVDTANGLARSQLDLSVKAGPNATDTTFAKSLSRALELNEYEINASLTFDHAHQTHTDRATVAQARARLLRSKVDERAARARIASNATRAVQRARAALAAVDLGETATELAKQNIENERKK